jgi:hypothetical protein
MELAVIYIGSGVIALILVILVLFLLFGRTA